MIGKEHQIRYQPSNEETEASEGKGKDNVSGTDNKQRKLQAGGYNGLEWTEREIDLRGDGDECGEIQRWCDGVLRGRTKLWPCLCSVFNKASHKKGV